jgi:hypothetical protein
MIGSSVPTFRDKLSVTFSWVNHFKKNFFFFWGCLKLEGGADRLSQNVGNYQLMLRDIPEDGKILLALTQKSEIKHNINFGDARFVTVVVKQNFGNIDVAYRYPRSWSVQADCFRVPRTVNFEDYIKLRNEALYPTEHQLNLQLSVF